MSKGICDGRAALGACDKTALYKVADEESCGIHLAQIVKFHLTFADEVPVARLSNVIYVRDANGVKRKVTFVD